jgi:hypothetical protein
LAEIALLRKSATVNSLTKDHDMNTKLLTSLHIEDWNRDVRVSKFTGGGTNQYIWACRTAYILSANPEKEQCM